jgi:hypothetical protein
MKYSGQSYVVIVGDGTTISEKFLEGAFAESVTQFSITP